MQDIIHQLVTGSSNGQTPFIYAGPTMDDVHHQAMRIRTTLRRQTGPLPVCLCTEDRYQVAAALLAALSGGPPLILPYAFSKQALAQTKEETSFYYLLVDRDQTVPNGTHAIHMHQIPEAERDPAKPEPIGPDDEWVYLFTGGSTGHPQTWTKTVRNLLAEAQHLAETFHITSQDVILATVPPHHIYGLLYAVLIPLITGAQVISHTPTFPNEIIDALRQTHASVLVSIPAHYRAMKNHALAKHHLNIAFSSAGPLAPEDDLAFFDMTGVAITEVYGSTETGGIAHRQRAAGHAGLRPFNGIRWKIENEQLWVNSHFLSNELPRDTDGFFQTADRVALDHNQGFQLLGRTDGIIKVAGKRVDLATVQQALKQLPGVNDAYVFARSVKQGRENDILAMVEGNTTSKKLHDQLHNKLEPYSQPRHIMVVPKMPVSKVGKYDRNAIEKQFE